MNSSSLNGGLAWVLGNIIGQSPTTDNRDLISYGAEGQRWPENALDPAHNTLVTTGWGAPPAGLDQPDAVWD